MIGNIKRKVSVTDLLRVLIFGFITYWVFKVSVGALAAFVFREQIAGLSHGYMSMLPDHVDENMHNSEFFFALLKREKTIHYTAIIFSAFVMVKYFGSFPEVESESDVFETNEPDSVPLTDAKDPPA